MATLLCLSTLATIPAITPALADADPSAPPPQASAGKAQTWHSQLTDLLPDEPWACIAIRQDSHLAHLAQSLGLPGAAATPAASEGEAILSLASAFACAAPVANKPETALLAVLPPSQLLALPGPALLIKTSDPSALLARLWPGCKLAEKPAGILARRDGVAACLKSGLLCFVPATEASAWLTPTAPSAKTADAALDSFASPQGDDCLLAYADGPKCRSLIAFALAQELKVNNADNLLRADAFGAAVRISNQEGINLSIKAALPQAQEQAGLVGRLARMMKIALSAGQSSNAPYQLALKLESDGGAAYPLAKEILFLLAPNDCKQTQTSFDMLAQLTGVHAERDFLSNLDGNCRLLLGENGSAWQAELGLRDEKRAAFALARTAYWSNYFQARKLTPLLLAVTDSRGSYELLRPGFGREASLTLEDQMLKIATPSAPSPQLAGTQVKGGFQTEGNLATAWVTAANEAEMLRALNTLESGMCSIAALANDNSPQPAYADALAEYCLLAILEAECTYRSLELENGTPGNARTPRFMQEIWRLESIPCANNQKANLLQSDIAAAAKPEGTQFRHMRFAAARSIGGQPVDWSRQLAVFAYFRQADKEKARTYLIREDGSIHRLASGNPLLEDAPADLEKSGWTQIRQAIR